MVLQSFGLFQDDAQIQNNTRLDDPHATQLRLLVEWYWLLLHDTRPTHQLGGTLDAVVTDAVVRSGRCLRHRSV